MATAVTLAGLPASAKAVISDEVLAEIQAPWPVLSLDLVEPPVSAARNRQCFAVDRIRDALDAWLIDENNTLAMLAARIGFSPRRLYAILNTQQSVSVDIADKVLWAIDRLDLWYAPKDQGGLRDIYFAEEVIGL